MKYCSRNSEKIGEVLPYMAVWLCTKKTGPDWSPGQSWQFDKTTVQSSPVCSLFAVLGLDFKTLGTSKLVDPTNNSTDTLPRRKQSVSLVSMSSVLWEVPPWWLLYYGPNDTWEDALPDSIVQLKHRMSKSKVYLAFMSSVIHRTRASSSLPLSLSTKMSHMSYWPGPMFFYPLGNVHHLSDW